MRVILIVFTLLFGGCATIKPTVAEYGLTIKETQANTTASGCKEKSLKVEQAFSSNSLMSLNMDYTEHNNRVFSYSESQWQESPNTLVTSLLLRNIRDSELFASVHPSKSRVKSDVVLEINIDEFMQFFAQDMKSSFVVVRLNLTLVDTKTNSVIKSQDFSSKIDTKTLDAKGGVEAIESALFEIVSQNIEWLGGVCK